MGVVKKVLGPVGQLLVGGDKPKKSPVIEAPAASASTAKSPAEMAAAEEEDRRKRLVALNAGGNNGQLTQAGGDQSQAPVYRKALLGQ